MKTTRRILSTECRVLRAQLAASGHESRKVRAAKLKALGDENAKLSAQIAAQTAELTSLRSLNEELRAKIAA